MLAQIRAVRHFDFVVYDNACALAQHVRAQHRRLAITCVLDMAEVDINKHPELEVLNTE